MPKHSSYEYFIIRVVPYVEREEFINVGVVIYCKDLRFLSIKLDMALERLASFSPQTDLNDIREHLSVMQKVAEGGAEAGFFKNSSNSERFNWLAAKSSTIIQTSAIHSGLTKKPQQTLDDLFQKVVLTSKI